MQQGSLLPWQGGHLLEQSPVHTRQEGLNSVIYYLQTVGTRRYHYFNSIFCFMGKMLN